MISRNDTLNFIDKWDLNVQHGRCYGVKICLSGAETKQLRDALLSVGVKRIVVSYNNLKSWVKNRSYEEILADFGRFDYRIIDSGTNGLPKDKQSDKDFLLRYISEYYSEISRWGNIFAGCIDVDIPSNLISKHELDLLREEKLFFDNLNLIPNLKGLDIDELESSGVFEKNCLVAVGKGIVGNNTYLRDLFRACERNEVLVHARGIADLGTINHSKFYSVDSSTWLNGSKFGATQVFLNGRIRHYDQKNKHIRRTYRTRFEDAGLNWDAIEKDDPFETKLMNALAWSQLSDHLRFSTYNSYWLSSGDINSAVAEKNEEFSGAITRREPDDFGSLKGADLDDRAHEVLYCDNCLVGSKCPRFAPNSPCGFAFNIRLDNAEDIHSALRVMAEAQYSRTMTGVFLEKMSGGDLDPRVSKEIMNFSALIEMIRRIYEPQSDEELTIKARSRKSGALSGILASVFAPKGSGSSGSGLTTTQREANKIIDVTPKKK